MTSALHAPCCAADDEVRQREVIVRVAVAHVAAVEQHRVVEQRAVAVGRVLQLLQELAELRDVVGLDLLTFFSIFSARFW